MRTRLRAGEEVAAVVRRHWIVLIGPLGLALFLAGGLLASAFIERPGLALVIGSLFALSAAWAVWRVLDWRCDLWVVTTQRVIDETGVLAVQVIDSPLDTIHNVGCQQSLLGRILGYGTVEIQTAAERGATVIERAARPQDLREAVLELKELYRKGGAAEPRAEAPEAGTKECPFCAETIKVRATVCRFCGRTL